MNGNKIASYTIYQESFAKENFRDMSIVTVFARWEFSDSVMKSKEMTFNKETIQENVCECTKIHEIRKHFLSQMIPNIRYVCSYIASP